MFMTVQKYMRIIPHSHRFVKGFPHGFLGRVGHETGRDRDRKLHRHVLHLQAVPMVRHTAPWDTTGRK